MKTCSVLKPAVAVVLVISLGPAATTACFFGKLKCFDGQTMCMNPWNVVACTFNTISPIKLDDIIKSIGSQLREITTDPVQFAVDLGEDTINGIFNDMKGCYKGLTGKETTCSELHTVKTCLSTAVNLWPVASAAGKTAKLSADNLKRANKAISVLQDTVVPALDAQCASGCLGEKKCGGSNAATTTTATTTTTTTTTACTDTTTPGNSTPTTPVQTIAAAPVTLKYSPPAGCVCKQMEAQLHLKDAVATTASTCARNLAFLLTGANTVMGKAYFKEMGCFVGKFTAPGCTSASLATQDDIGMHDSDDWLYADLQFFMFVPCVDQFNRTYTRRDDPVTSALMPTTAPTPAPTPRCNLTTTTTTTTTVNLTSADSAAATTFGFTMTFVHVVLLSIAACLLMLRR